ncbi:MAG: hypothetical protein LBU72_01555 [Burkholderiaceae bacterium]|jgi:hypothetical protein|nr:hypothetical protein [Burkholderiaceae bacterium]
MTNVKLTPALIAVDALLAIVLAALWLAPGPFAHWRNWQTPAPQAPNLDDARAAQLAPNPALRHGYPAITERPLFAADRKPRAAASDAQAAAAPSDSLDQVKLYGLVDGPAAQGVLLEQNGQPQFVRRGEKIGDWTLQAIEDRNAIFVKGEASRTIPLPNSLADAASLAAASAPASAAANGAAVQQPGLLVVPSVPQPGFPVVPQPVQQPGLPVTPQLAPRPGLPVAPQPGKMLRLAPSPALPGVSGGATSAQAQPQPAVPVAGGPRPAAQHTAGF